MSRPWEVGQEATDVAQVREAGGSQKRAVRRGPVWGAFWGVARAWLMDGMLGVRKRMGSRMSPRFLARVTGCMWFHLLY